MNTPRKDYFDVTVKILECRGLSTQIKNLSTQISVQVGDEKKYSKVIRHSATPFFDEYFVITKFMTLAEFLDTLITLSAHHIRKGVRIRKLVGCISMDVATVWNQPARLLKKWFALSLPSDHSVQRKAFVECELRIGTCDDYNEYYHFSTFESSDIIGTKRARYKVLIYHCVGLDVQATTLKEQGGVSVRVWYAGKCKQTSIKKLNEVMEWNEQIAFLDLFPPMRQRLTVELCLGQKVLASRVFTIIDFLKIFQGGFLNMFGPTFIHMYRDNNLYQGSLLLSLENEILGQLREFEHADGMTVSQIEPISQIKYGINKTFVFFAIIFELVIFKPNCGVNEIYLTLEMGNTNISTEKFTAKSDKFVYVPFGKSKPCISLTCDWPDCTHRLYNANVLATLTRDLREKLDITIKMASKGCEKEARRSLLSACHSFRENYNRVVRLLSKGITELDSKRAAFMGNQISLLATLLSSDINLNNVTELCRFFFNIHNDFCEEIQGTLPLLIITIHQGKNIVGSCAIHPRDLIFSEVKVKRGMYSGKLKNLFLYGKDDDLVGETDMWLWLGKREQTNKCAELFPKGFEPYCLPKTNKLQLPCILRYNTRHTYTAVCHVHSGFIHDKVVNESDCDSFVKVIFHNRSRQTITAKRTLAPFWKQTLIIMDINLYIPPSYLVNDPPRVTLQFWNDTGKQPKLIGSAIISSTVSIHPSTNVAEFPLKWWDVGNECELLAACEIFPVTLEENLKSSHKTCNLIPRFLEPKTVSYRFEIIFWGMRPTRANVLRDLIQPQVYIEFSTASLCSGVIARANTTFNFNHDSNIVSLKLPKNKLLSPPLMIKIISNFKYLTLISEKNIYRFEYDLPTKSLWEMMFTRKTTDRSNATPGSGHQVTFPDLIPQAEVNGIRPSSLGAILQMPNRIKSIISEFSDFSKFFHSSQGNEYESDSDDEVGHDWWDRYWGNQLEVYDKSLEEQEEYSGFSDILTTFPVIKKNDDLGISTEIGKLKAIISLYKWPEEESVVTMQGQDPEMGILKLSQLNSRVSLLVRVYCIKATNLYPSDLNGKSDPYIEVATQSKTVSDKLNKKIADLNPTFGNYHEIVAILPIDTMLAVRVMDWDAFSKDDIIGETIIDIENRFYSKHRATCGLPETYATTGANAWRDIETPKEILERLCNAHNIPLPQYHEKSLSIGSREVFIHKTPPEKEEAQQRLALAALKQWVNMPIIGCPLVGEHVETRSLFKEGHPGLVRGKLTMWVDMFDMSLGHVPPAIDITPRAPQAFELRVNILNTENIPLVDVATFGDKKCTDIMVSGWLGDPKKVQKTDVHHNSYTGTGNFNWRFVFPFMYYRKENLMVFNKKNLFDIGRTEEKTPAVIHLEVYDSEGLLESSLIGGMMLELCHMPRGANSAKSCKPEKIYQPTNYVDLFKVESLRGWWPFLVNKTVLKDRGVLEAEFYLITAEEARKYPAGLGRSPPDPLPRPERARYRLTSWRFFEELFTRQNFQVYFGFSLNVFVVLSLVFLLGVLIYVLPSTFDKLKPWLEQLIKKK